VDTTHADAIASVLTAAEAAATTPSSLYTLLRQLADGAHCTTHLAAVASFAAALIAGQPVGSQAVVTAYKRTIATRVETTAAARQLDAVRKVSRLWGRQGAAIAAV